MKSFITAHNKVVNLKNVSNINIIRNFKNSHFRIIFNMNYCVALPDNKKTDNKSTTKLISDYVYWDFNDVKSLEESISTIENNEHFSENFIDQIDDRGYINLNEVSSIKFSENKKRVIFNLSHPVTFIDFDKKEKITSEFVFINCGSLLEYKEYVKYLEENL